MVRASISCWKSRFFLQRFPWTNSRVEVSSKENVSSFLLRFAPIFDGAVETATPHGITFKVWQRSHCHPLGPRPAVVKFHREAVFRLCQCLEKLYCVQTLVLKGLCICGMYGGCVGGSVCEHSREHTKTVAASGGQTPQAPSAFQLHPACSRF